MKLLIFCSAWMYKIPSFDGWDVYANVQEKDPSFSLLPKFGKEYVKVINEIKPDFVLAINVGCSEHLFDRMPKRKGTIYITWSTDSYRHTTRAKTSDLHLSSIPDSSLSNNDHFVPLFFEHHEPPNLPLNKRKWRCGIHCRKYTHDNNYRQNELARLQRSVPDLHVGQNQLHPFEYIKEIKQYQYGFNVGVYRDALPNFRSFEYGACGVMPVSERTAILEQLFDNNIILYDDPTDIKYVDYNPIKLQVYYNQHHSLTARIKYIFKKFYGIELK